MILDWNADSYVDGISHAFVPESIDYAPALGASAQFTLVYDPFSFVWVQYAGTAPEALTDAPSGFQLIYDGWTMVWVQYGLGTAFPSWQADGRTECTFVTPTATTGSFSAAGTGSATFEFEPFADSFFLAQGSGGNTWNGFSDIASGFTCNGKSTCNFYSADASLVVRMDGKSRASFEGISVEASGFECHATGGAKFMGTIGTGEECISPGAAPEGSFPNFVF